MHPLSLLNKGATIYLGSLILFLPEALFGHIWRYTSIHGAIMRVHLLAESSECLSFFQLAITSFHFLNTTFNTWDTPLSIRLGCLFCSLDFPFDRKVLSLCWMFLSIGGFSGLEDFYEGPILSEDLAHWRSW
jgi:hypothetical protein